MSHFTRRAKLRTLAVAGTLTWVTTVMGLYYWVHKPLTPELAAALAGALLDSLTAVAFAGVGAGLGRRLLRWLDLSFLSSPERLAAEGLIGLSMLSLLILGVGSVILNAGSVALLLVIVAALTRRDLFAWLAEFAAWLRKGLPAEKWPRFLAFTALTMIVLAFVLALLPPSKWDVLTYHLAGPKQYVQHGRFYAVPHNHFLGFPQLVDSLYAGQLALTGRLTGAAAIHWIIGIFMVMAAGGFAARRAGESAGWMAVTVLLAAASIWQEMTFAYADLLPIAYSVLALALVERWQTVRRGDIETATSWRSGLGYLLLLGVVIGFGMSTKYTTLWLGIGFGVLVAGLGLRESWRHALRYGALYALTASAVLAPWLIRNAIWYHNPVYPLVFESAEMDAIRQDWYSQPKSGLIYGQEAWLIPTLPITATFLGVEGAGKFATDIGPLFLMLVPLSLLAWAVTSAEERRTLLYAFAVSGVIGGIWIASAAFGSYISLFTRLVFYLFGPLALVAAISLNALDRLPKKPLDLSFVVKSMVGLTLVFMVISGVRFFAAQGVQVYFSGDSDYEDAYLESALGWHYETMQRVNQLPAGTTVRFLWEPRYLYCDLERIDCITDSLMDAWYYARRTVGEGSPAEIAARWQGEGVDYLLVYEFGRDFEEDSAPLYTPEDWAAWRTFVREHLIEEWHTGNADDDVQYVLYRWRN
jgi:hypothetical protein